jgi:hypothetical protein
MLNHRRGAELPTPCAGSVRVSPYGFEQLVIALSADPAAP